VRTGNFDYVQEIATAYWKLRQHTGNRDTVQEIATAYWKSRQHTGNFDTVQEIATAYWKWLALVRHHTTAHGCEIWRRGTNLSLYRMMWTHSKSMYA